MLIMIRVGQILLVLTCENMEVGWFNIELDEPLTDLSTLFFVPKIMNGWGLQNITTASCLGIYCSFKVFLLIVKTMLIQSSM